MMASKVSNAINKAKYKVDKCDPRLPFDGEHVNNIGSTKQQ